MTEKLFVYKGYNFQSELKKTGNSYTVKVWSPDWITVQTFGDRKAAINFIKEEIKDIKDFLDETRF